MRRRTTLSCLVGLIIALQSLAQPQLVGTLQYLGPENGGSIFRYNLPATTPGTIYSFNNLAPHRPIGGLALGDADWVYGVLSYNGVNGSGLLYKIKRDGTGFTTLHTFSGNSNTTPYYHSDGFIYFIDLYVIKRLDPSDNSITDVFSGSAPFVKSLLIDTDDWIYYNTFTTVEKVKTDGTNQTVLHTFSGTSEGNSSLSGLTEAPGDSIFGVNIGGGDFNGGTIYSVKKDGSGFTVHHHFTMATGAYPDSKLVYFDGKLYGTTQQGGDNNIGVIYTIRPDGSDYRVIHHFEPGTPAIALPFGNISITSDGRIFGMFYQHMYSGGTPYKLYKVDTSGANFEPFLSVTTNNQRDYGHLNVDFLLTQSQDSIFLATQEMGRHEGGVLSKFDTLGNSLFGQYHFGYSVNGFRPIAGVIKGTDGKLYGTAKIGGADGAGIIYSVNADGTAYTNLHEFTDAQGFELSGKLLEGTDGKLYGASSQNAGGGGTIFRINKNGSGFEVIHSFTDLTMGYAPLGSLVEDNTGALFGTTNYSTIGAGVVFKMNKDGSGYTVLKTFDGSEIYFPVAGLFVSGNYLYGACNTGGAEFKGGIFRIQKNGAGYQVLHEFNGSSDGSNPYAAPFIANNGKLYGTTGNGGTNFQGTVYSMDITGANYSILHNFSDAVDGAYTYAGVIQASDGLIYGTTSFSNIGGDFGGTIYKMNLDGSGFAVVKVFDEDAEGQSAPASLVDLQSFAAPVQWISFTASKKETSVLLTWKTAQEQNSKNFEIERSSDGRSYKRIGSITAAGNSIAIKNYTYSDDQPLKGLNYYRLKQNDLDSKFKYSEVVSVNYGGFDKLLVFPNPARDQLSIQVPANSGFTSLHVLDASGKLVMQKQMISGASKLEIDIRKLPAGLYILQLRGEKTIEQKFLKTGR